MELSSVALQPTVNIPFPQNILPQFNIPGDHAPSLYPQILRYSATPFTHRGLGLPALLLHFILESMIFWGRFFIVHFFQVPHCFNLSDNIRWPVIMGQFMTVHYSAFSFLFNWTVYSMKDSSFKLLVQSCSQSDCLNVLFLFHTSELL